MTPYVWASEVCERYLSEVPYRDSSEVIVCALVVPEENGVAVQIKGRYIFFPAHASQVFQRCVHLLEVHLTVAKG